MKSNPSSSTASSSWFRKFDPSVVLLPIFVGFLRAAPFAAFFAMFLGTEFGLSGHLPAPTAWALAPIGAIGFWTVRLLPKFLKNSAALNIAFLALGIALWVIWMGLEPHWHIGPALRNPVAMVTTEGRLAWVFIITMVFWLLTLRLALDEREQSSEGVRGIMVRSLIFVIAGIVLAAVVGGDMGDDGLNAGYVALPVALVSGIGAVGLSEMSATRAAARRRGAQVPGWNRWGRTFAGSAAIVLVLTFAAALVFGPGFLSLVIDTMATIWHGISTVILWIMYGVVYVIFWIVRGIVWLFNLFFDTNVEPMEMLNMGQQATPEPLEMMPEEETEPWKYAGLLRFGGIVALVAVGLLLLSRFARFRSRDTETNADEERSSVFSGSMLRDQLRNLFRRGPHEEKPRRIDLASDPPSVRESMLYLQVLAARLEMPRKEFETPHDFAIRLSESWPTLNEPLAEMNRRYERARYGEREEDREAVVREWRQIWRHHAENPKLTSK